MASVTPLSESPDTPYMRRTPACASTSTNNSATLCLAMTHPLRGMDEETTLLPVVSIHAPATPPPRSVPLQCRWRLRRTDERRSAIRDSPAGLTAPPQGSRRRTDTRFDPTA